LVTFPIIFANFADRIKVSRHSLKYPLLILHRHAPARPRQDRESREMRWTATRGKISV